MPGFKLYLIWCSLDAIWRCSCTAGIRKSMPLVGYNDAMQPLVNISIGGQWLSLVFDLSSGNTLVFVKEYDACTPVGMEPCYSYNTSKTSGTISICAENNDNKVPCTPGRGADYSCTKTLAKLASADPHPDTLVVDGLPYNQLAVEAKDDMQVNVFPGPQLSNFPDEPFRLLVRNMSVPVEEGAQSPLRLFEGASGLLGASGKSLSCRSDTPWSRLMGQHFVSVMVLEFAPPPISKFGRAGTSAGQIVFNDLDAQMLWSEPKQTGDTYNDGTYEFLMYHPTVCGVDLLYNTSSNWLVIVDTSGPCLSLPAFLFDRLMVQLPVSCPFEQGQPSQGQLCSPRRVPSCGGTAKEALCRFPFEYKGTKYTECAEVESSRPWCSTDRVYQGRWGYCDCPGQPALNITLPSLKFSLEDAQDPSPELITLSLERLVFNSDSGEELLCVARAGRDGWMNSADMMANTITLGSLTASAMIVAMSLENDTIGLASLGDPAAEGTDQYCTAPVSCPSPMQTFYPPLNICKDPACSEYMLTTLDEETKTCVWQRAVPIGFMTLLFILAALDVLSHRWYKMAILQAGGEFAGR